MKTEIINYMIAQKLKGLKQVVRYYENSYLPEIEEYTGSSQSEHLERAKNKLHEFEADVNDYRITKNTVFLEFTETEKANYLRSYAIYQRQEAHNFSYNIRMKWERLRNCIEALNELKNYLPELQIYTNHWLSSNNVITLKEYKPTTF